jgi:hypothetical protein
MGRKALLLAAVALATLVLASPAVARPSVHSVVYLRAVSGALMITVVCLAAAAAIALVTGVVLASQSRPRTKASGTAPEQLQAPRVKKVSSRRQAVV